MSRIEQITGMSTQLFYLNAFRVTSIREIATRLNIKPAILYNHFNAKEDLLTRTILRLAH